MHHGLAGLCIYSSQGYPPTPFRGASQILLSQTHREFSHLSTSNSQSQKDYLSPLVYFTASIGVSSGPIALLLTILFTVLSNSARVNTDVGERYSGMLSVAFETSRWGGDIKLSF